MKSISQMAEALNISSGTIREYLDRFNEFFPDPVDNLGVKEYPPDTEDLIKKIYVYYQNSGMTKEQIRVKLGGEMASEEDSPVPAAAGPAIDARQFDILAEKLDRLTQMVENLTTQLSNLTEGEKASSGKNRNPLEAINAQIEDIMEMNMADDFEKIEQRVKGADGTVIFSYGRMSEAAGTVIKCCKSHGKPWIHIDLETEKRPAPTVRMWLREFKIRSLNVAGRSATKIPGLKKTLNDMIAGILDG